MIPPRDVFVGKKPSGWRHETLDAADRASSMTNVTPHELAMLQLTAFGHAGLRKVRGNAVTGHVQGHARDQLRRAHR